MKRIAGEFWNQTGGVAAIEFGFLAPVMVMLFLGMVELSDSMFAKRKLTSMTSTVADLISRARAVDDSDVADVYTAALAILDPADPLAVAIRITSVTVNLDSTTQVGWSDALHMAALAPGASITLPPNIGRAGGSVIKVEANYTHPNIIAYISPAAREFEEVFYMQPRRTLSIERVP